jgi:AcrR family transcriptional regulator
METRTRIVAAALETLKAEGYADTSARTIARRGGFNQALIFYHFGSINDVLLAALAESSRQRMVTYEAAIQGVRTLPAAITVARELFAEDLRAGHIKVLVEVIAAANSNPELGPRVMELIRPWIDFTEAQMVRILGRSPLARAFPPDNIAFGLCALYLGSEMLTHVGGDTDEADRLFDSGMRIAKMVNPLLRVTGGGRK